MNAMEEERRYPLNESVAELAAARGVSERTVWRWVARVRAGEEPPWRRSECDECGGPLPARATIARRYCTDACRVSAHRRSTRLTAPTK
jgi:ferredoxin